jgi:ABC-type transport system substrate-binding protein
MVYNGLVRLNGNNQVVPDLAASMPTLSPDRRTYTFKLRPHLTFSDGTPLTSADVVASLTRALSKAEASPSSLLYLGHIKGAAALSAGKTKVLAGVSAPDASTVQITTDANVSGFFLASLTFPTAFVLKKGTPAGVDLVGPGAEYRNIGAGPFMFDPQHAWNYHQKMYLVPNPNYYNAGKIQLKGIDVQFTGTLETNYAEYLSGQIPVTMVPSAHLATDRTKPDFHRQGQLATVFLVPNLGANGRCKPMGCAPFNDLHFRRALTYAIDRGTIDNKILHGEWFPLCSFVPKGIAGYDDTDLCPLAAYNPARARAELALARQDFGGTLPNDGSATVVYPAGFQDGTNALVELQSEWAAVGITMHITAIPGNEWFSRLSAHYTPFLAFGLTADYPDPQDFCENILSSASGVDPGNFSNASYQKLLTAGDTTPPGPDRTKIYVQAQKIALQNVAYIMIGQQSQAMRWRSNIHGMYLSTLYGFYPADNDWTNASVS